MTRLPLYRSSAVLEAPQRGQTPTALAVKIGSRTYTAHTDMQGTVWAFSDEQGNVAAVFGYDAWGNVVSCTYAPGAEALAGVRYGFQGREHSRLTGFIHFRMRWYDPVAGRWL